MKAKRFSALRLVFLCFFGLFVVIPILVGLYIWKNCGYDLILFLAGLAAIPKEYREAAASEGASYWQIVR